MKNERSQSPEDYVSVEFSDEDWEWITNCAAADGQDPQEWVIERIRSGLLKLDSIGKLHGKN